MIEDPAAVIAVAGGVSGIGGLVGSIIGNKYAVEWLKEKVADHAGKITAHDKAIREHDLKIALIERGYQP